MTAVDWLWIVHPFLAVVLIYPLIGMVIRLGVQTRARRQKTNLKLPANVGRSHTDLGRWLAAGVVRVCASSCSNSHTSAAPARASNPCSSRYGSAGSNRSSMVAARLATGWRHGSGFAIPGPCWRGLWETPQNVMASLPKAGTDQR